MIMATSIFNAASEFTWDESPDELMYDVAKYNRLIKQLIQMKTGTVLPSGMVEILRVALRDATEIRNILETKLRNM
jgi:hypothetical protein